MHSDTPSGMLNPVDVLCPVLKKYGILTVVDSVTGMFADPLQVDASQIDIVCGGSQKALSAPPGLTLVSVSPDASQAMHARKTPIRSFYANLMALENYYADQWFPYTMPVSDIMGLRQALDNMVADEDHLQRHYMIAHATREAMRQAGLSLYLESGYASSVTVFCVPEGLKSEDILNKMVQEHHIMIAGCFDVLAGKVIRVGHMGGNANRKDMVETLQALQQVLSELGYPLQKNMAEVFENMVY